MLEREYPQEFERLWKAWPKFPTGRSKKEPSFKAFQKAKKDLQLTQEDLEVILANIEERKRYCVTWQKGNKYGPEMFATYFNQHRWNEPFERIRGAAAHVPSGAAVSEVTDEENNVLFVLSCIKRGQVIPPELARYEEQARGRLH